MCWAMDLTSFQETYNHQFGGLVLFFNLIGNYSHCNRINVGKRLFLGLSISHYAWNVSYFRYLSPVIFAFCFHTEIH